MDNATSSAYADLSSSLLNNDHDASAVDGDDEDGDDVYASFIFAVRVRDVSSIVRRLQSSVGGDDLDETSRREDDETRLLICAAGTLGGTRSRADTLVFGKEEVIIIANDVLGVVERRTTPRP